MTQFIPGQSGNPAGRPKGARGLRTQRRVMLAEHVPQIVESIKLIALHGDTEDFRTRIKLILQL